MAKSRTSRKPSKNAKHLAPRTSTAEPGENNGGMVLVPKRVSGLWVNEASALTCASVWACVRVISEGEAKLPWFSYKRRKDGGRDRAADQPSDWLLNIQANPETSAFTFRETLFAHVLTWGNGYAEIERDMLDRPVWLWQITPDRVEVARTAGGRIVYDVKNDRAPNTVLEAKDIFHLKGLGYDGLVGYSVIRMHARTIGSGLAADKAATDLWENDTTPGGLLKHKGRLSDKARQNLLESWQRRHGNNRRMVGILEEGMEWAQTSLPPEDMQLLQTRQFTPLEICRIYRVQPHKIADLTRATFSNIEEQNREHVEDTLMPWAVRGEQEANVKLFLPNQQRQFYTKHNFNALLRGNAAQRSDFYTKMFYLGMSLNQIFELEDMNPIGPDGDKRFVPMNLQLLEKAGEEPGAASNEAGESSEGDTVKNPKASAAQGDVQATALNGAQIASLLQVIMNVATKQMPPETGKATLEGSFPLMSEELIDEIIDPIEDWEPPPPPEAPGGQPPSNGGEGGAPPDDEAGDETDDDSDDDLRMMPLLEDLCGRVLRKESHLIADSAKKNGDLESWLTDFLPKHQEHVRKDVISALKVLSPKAHDLAATIFLADHIDGLANRCRRLASGEAIEPCPVESAKQLLAAARAANIKRNVNGQG